MNDQESPVELTSTTPGPLRTALEAYHNANSGHYERMEAVVAALMAEHAQRAEALRRKEQRAVRETIECPQETSALRAEVEALRRDAECWRAAKADADQWGSALNAAGWAQLDAYRKHIGETESARFFNSGKSILRDSIGAYLTAIDAAVVRAAAAMDKD